MKQTIIAPIISEKSLSLASRGWYTFAVDPASNKGTVAKAVSDFYSVKVEEVRSMIMQGKERRAGKRNQKTRGSDWKKALVRLKSGQKIDAFEVTGEAEKK